MEVATKAEVEQLLRDMGLSMTDFSAVDQAPSLEEAHRQFAALKEKIKRGFNKMALELHPDRTGNDPVKTERFKLLLSLKADLDKLQVNPNGAGARQVPIPVPVAPFRQHVVINYYHVRPVQPPARSVAPQQRAYSTATMSPGGTPFVPGVIFARVR